MYFFVWRMFIKLFCFGLRIGENSFFDEVEVWQKFKVLGSGDVIFIKLIGGQEGMVVIFFLNLECKNVLIGYMMVRFVEVVDELE